MKFHLLNEQNQIQDSVRRTLEALCPSQTRRAIIATGDDRDRAVWEGVMALGLGGLLIPADHGGSGLGVLDAVLAMEVVGHLATPVPLFGHVLAGLAIARATTDAAGGRWLAGLADGSYIGAVAFDVGWEPGAWSAVLERGRLTGSFRFVPGARHADVFVAGIAGGGIVAIDAGAEGIEITPLASSDLTRPAWSVQFHAAPCMPLGGKAVGQTLFDAALLLLAADALGGAQRCVELSVGSALTREQFDHPIGQFQALKHQLANMAVEVEPARALVWYGAYAADAGLPDATRAIALAKAPLADRFVSIARAAIQAHGRIGYTWDYDLQLWFRRSLFDRAFLGAPSLHRERAAVLAGW